MMVRRGASSCDPGVDKQVIRARHDLVTGDRKGWGPSPMQVTKLSLEWLVQEAFSTVVAVVHLCLKASTTGIITGRWPLSFHCTGSFFSGHYF